MLKKYSVTVSIGVAELTERDDKDELLKRADKALSEAKGISRNLVCLAKPLKEQRDHEYVPYGRVDEGLLVEVEEDKSVVMLKPARNGML